MSLVLGIDPGSRVTGYGLVSTAGNGLEYVDSGCIKTTEKATLPERLDMI
ncbi:MAG: crossover junction endodeoxyribonuclease RuvC, partial [Pseudomonadales bacterium]